MIHNIPDGANMIIQRLQLYGFDAYIVGGCVRDSLYGAEPKDWDICTSATPQEVKMRFLDVKVIDTGLKHGTVTLMLDDGKYEVTTFRTEGAYTDNRHPDTVEFVTNIVEDLARRDFTINAMAYNTRDGLIDPFGGLSDLANDVLRCVGDADERFNEDGLRIMRALRFASVYGFEIEVGTALAIHKNAHLLQNIAAERINAELCKLVCGFKVRKVLLEYSDVITEIIPELKACVGFEQNNRLHDLNVYDHIAKAVSNRADTDPVIGMALLLHDVGKPYCYTEDEKGGHFKGHPEISARLASDVLTRLRFDKKSREAILELILYHDDTIAPTPRSVRRWLNKLGDEQFVRLIQVKYADIRAHKPGTQTVRIEALVEAFEIGEKIMTDNTCFSMKDLMINGYAIMALGVPEGRMIGEILQACLDAVIDDVIPNECDVLVDFAEKYWKERNNVDRR